MAYEDILAAVDAVRLMDSVRAICTGERLSNEAEVRSFDVLEKLFTDAGCRVTREALPGYVSTPEGAAFEAGGIAYEVLTHPMTPSADGLEADLVYVPVDRTGSASAEEVSGRIVLTDGLAMEPVVRALEDRGAAGVVFITGEEIHNMIVSRVWARPRPKPCTTMSAFPSQASPLGTALASGPASPRRAARCPQGFRPASKAAGRKFPSLRPRSAARTRTS